MARSFTRSNCSGQFSQFGFSLQFFPIWFACFAPHHCLKRYVVFLKSFLSVCWSRYVCMCVCLDKAARRWNNNSCCFLFSARVGWCILLTEKIICVWCFSVVDCVYFCCLCAFWTRQESCFSSANHWKGRETNLSDAQQVSFEWLRPKSAEARLKKANVARERRIDKQRKQIALFRARWFWRGNILGPVLFVCCVVVFHFGCYLGLLWCCWSRSPSLFVFIYYTNDQLDLRKIGAGVETAGARPRAFEMSVDYFTSSLCSSESWLFWIGCDMQKKTGNPAWFVIPLTVIRYRIKIFTMLTHLQYFVWFCIWK